MKSIKKNICEVVVNSTPMGLILALEAVKPGIGSFIGRHMGAADYMEKLALWNETAHPS